jgi:hypothetical protein
VQVAVTPVESATDPDEHVLVLGILMTASKQSDLD